MVSSEWVKEGQSQHHAACFTIPAFLPLKALTAPRAQHSDPLGLVKRKLLQEILSRVFVVFPVLYPGLQSQLTILHNSSWDLRWSLLVGENDYLVFCLCCEWGLLFVIIIIVQPHLASLWQPHITSVSMRWGGDYDCSYVTLRGTERSQSSRERGESPGGLNTPTTHCHTSDFRRPHSTTFPRKYQLWPQPGGRG